MSSDHPDQVKEVRQGGEDDLLGVIADVERQLESLKSHRAERDAFRMRLEEREQELIQRDRDLTLAEEALKERASLQQVQEDQQAQRLRDLEAAEADLSKRRDKLEHDFAALAEEQRRAAEAAARESAELKAMSVALEQREQRLADHAANISKQREAFETMGAELARRQEEAEREAAALQHARDEAESLKARLADSERQSTARIAELDQSQRRAADLEKRVAELSRSAEEARKQLEDQSGKLAEQLRVAREEVKRAGEAQSALMEEIAKRDKAAADLKRETELFKSEAARRQASATEAENRLADFKRQLIERDSRIQELSGKLAAATSKFREVSTTLQEQASLAEQAHALQEELQERDRQIAKLKAAALSAGDSSAHRADIEALEQQLQQMRQQLEESRQANRELKARVSEGGTSGTSGGEGGIPEEVGEAVMTRWRRLRLMRSLLQEQGDKLREASEAVRTRYAQAEQVLSQKDQLVQARSAIVAAQDKLQKLQAKASVGKAGVAMFYFVGALAGLVGLSWAISGEVTPSRYAARAVINADTRGRQTSEDQLAEWQKYLEAEVKDPRMHEVAAERMARAGIVSLATPGQLSQRLDQDLVADSAVPGSLTLELRGSGKAKTVRELDTLVTAIASQANATKERRPDGLGVLIAEKPNADAGPIDGNRVLYAGAIFGLGLVGCLGLGGLTYGRLSKAKVRLEQEADIDSILEESNWRQAEEKMREGRPKV